jgi:methyl-accepting chemotaxis protein
MSKSRFKGRPFGYSRRQVRQLVQEREGMVREAEARLRAAEGRILELRRDLAAVGEELSGRDAQIQTLGAQVEAFAGDPDRSTPNMLAEELNSILASAQETAAGMIDRARAVSERRLEQAGDFERDLHDDLTRMDEWRKEALPLIRDVQSRMGDIRLKLEEMAESVGEIAKPLEQLPDIDRPRLEEVAAAVRKFKGNEKQASGNGHRPRRRQGRSRPQQDQPDPTSEVIDITDRGQVR